MMLKNKNNIRKILAVRNDRFGEFLLNIPAIRALKETYPDAKITLAVSAEVKELAEAIEYADRIVVWDDAFRRTLRQQGFDACIVLNPTKEAHLASFLAGIPLRVGYNRKWGFLLTHKLKDTKLLGNRHEVDCNLELVSLIASSRRYVGTRNDEVLRLPRNDEYEFLAKSIAIHLFTSDPVKQWPVERFKELAQRITQEMKVKVVFVGRVEDRGLSPKGTVPSVTDVGDGIVSMINKTSLVELAALLKRCSLLVSCDSGPVHLAAAVGTPVVALFRNDIPGKVARRWGPWGEGHIVIEKSNIFDITVEEALDAVRKKYLTRQEISGIVS